MLALSSARNLLIPGSCGSSFRVPHYISSNPKTNLIFISNSAIGRGQVTNTLVQALIDFHKTGQEKIAFSDIIQQNAAELDRLGTKTKDIEIYSLGEALLDYVYKA